jgi:hypothetical protein
MGGKVNRLVEEKIKHFIDQRIFFVRILLRQAILIQTRKSFKQEQRTNFERFRNTVEVR